MFETGFLGGLLAKLAALGSAAKIGVATTTAALAITTAGGAAGLVALSGDSSPAATQGVAGQALGVVDDTTSTTVGGTDVQAGADATVSAPGASTASAAADASAGVETPEASVSSVPLPSLPTSVPGLPDLSGLADLPARVMACLDPVLDLVSDLPAVSPGQISQLAQGIVACVSGIVSDLPLPFGLNACISQIMGFFGGLGSGLGSGIPDVGNLDLSVCIPSGLPVPTGMFTGFGFMNGGFGFGR